MTDRFDADLHDRLERLISAVPVEPTNVLATARRMSPIGRTTWRSPVGLSAAPLLAVAVVVLVGAAIVGLARPAGPASSDDRGAGPVSATATDGSFELTIRADHGRYTATDSISIEASLVYTGPDSEIQISHGYGGPTGFGMVEPVYGIEMSPSWLLSCNSSTLNPGVALTTPFGKSGDVADDDPQADVKKQFLTDPVLRLPPGIWHIYALASFSIGGCGREEHQIRAEITIEVLGPAASAPATTAPSPSATDEPVLVASNIDSDGVFELTLDSTKAHYAPGEAIEIGATLSYTGPSEGISIGHAAGALGSPIAFGVTEPVVGDLVLAPGWDSLCEHSTVAPDSPIVMPFMKSGSFSSNDPRADEYRAYLTDPVLTLPPGIWHLFAVADLDVGDCGGEHHQLQAEITIAVGDSGEVAPSAEPTSAFPEACTGLGFSINQCAGFAAWAIGHAGTLGEPVRTIEMTRVQCPGGAPCPTESTGVLVNVRLVGDRGSLSDVTVDCTRRIGSLGGINILCDTMTTSDGRVLGYPSASSPAAGYHDVPCSGPAPENPCATPLPTIQPSALTQSAPLAISRLEIPIDHVGPYSIVLGQASLPNGILSAATADITSSPANPLVAYEGYHLTVTSLDGGPPFDNYYEHGWRPGVEHVQVTLDFTVLMFKPGAAVVIEGVDVH